MSARWWTLGVWALASGSGLFWAFKVLVAPIAAPPHRQTACAAAAPVGDLARLLGADALPPAAAAADEPVADARFQLIGVVSPRSPRAAQEGVALIAVDGNPPKAFRVGAAVDGTTALKSVAARGVTLGPRDGAAVVALNLAPPTPPATGVLPALGAVAPPAMRPPRPPPPGAMMRPPVQQPEPAETETEVPPQPVPPQQGLQTR